MHLKRVGAVKVGLEHGHGAEPRAGQVGHGGGSHASANIAHISAQQSLTKRASELGGERVVEDGVDGAEERLS